MSETRKAVAEPTARSSASVGVIIIPVPTNFAVFKRLAPSIVGIAIKKENSAAAVRERPRSDAPRIVAPERDVPGISERT